MLFPKFSKKDFGSITLLLLSFVHLTRVWREGLNEGKREDANRIFIIKTFLNINARRIIIRLSSW